MPRTKKEAAVAEENTVAEGAEALADTAAEVAAEAAPPAAGADADNAAGAAQGAEAAAALAEQAGEPVQTIRMVRHEDLAGPHTADVHPDEVENMKAGGWAVAPEPEEGGAE